MVVVLVVVVVVLVVVVVVVVVVPDCCAYLSLALSLIITALFLPSFLVPIQTKRSPNGHTVQVSNAPLGGLDWNKVYAMEGGLIKEAEEEAKGGLTKRQQPIDMDDSAVEGGGLCSAYTCSDERMAGDQFQQEKFDGFGVKKFDDAAEVSEQRKRGKRKCMNGGYRPLLFGCWRSFFCQRLLYFSSRQNERLLLSPVFLSGCTNRSPRR